MEEIREQYRELLTAMFQERAAVAPLEGAVIHFLTVTQSYWSGLFHCYACPGLPRTNTELEQFFGSARYQERRATGRKRASAATVVRGAVRLVASVVTRLCPCSAAHLCPKDPAALAKLRQEVNQRHEARRVQLRFRRDPGAYLAQVEQQLIQLGLPT